MPTFDDLDPLTFFGEDLSVSLRAVGWLGPERPFNKGRVSPDVHQRLRELLTNPFQPFVSAGVHSCELCQFEGEKMGSVNLFVPDDGVLLVCPELILHYINAHAYLPPQAFCIAVMACPDTRTTAYKRLFLESGGRRLMRHVDQQRDRL